MNEDKLVAKLDEILKVLQDLFILEASKVKMDKEELRAILKIDKNRIGGISKYVKEVHKAEKGLTDAILKYVETNKS